MRIRAEVRGLMNSAGKVHYFVNLSSGSGRWRGSWVFGAQEREISSVAAEFGFDMNYMTGRGEAFVPAKRQPMPAGVCHLQGPPVSTPRNDLLPASNFVSNSSVLALTELAVVVPVLANPLGKTAGHH